MQGVSNLIVMPQTSDGPISSECNNSIGDKFLYEYGTCSNGQKRYRFKDTTCNGSGLIGCAANGIMDAASGASDIGTSMSSDPNPVCKKLNLKICNVGGSSYSGNFESGEFYGVEEDFKQAGLNRGTDYVVVSESFKNLYESVNEYLDKTDYYNIDNKSNNDNINFINKTNLKDNTFNDLFYITLSDF